MSTPLKPESQRPVELVDSTALLSDPQALRARADEDGYLFFRGLLPTEPVLELRRRILDVLAARGWLKESADPLAAIADVERCAADSPTDSAFFGIGIGSAAYDDVQRLREFHELPHHPALINLYRTLFNGRDVLPHPRNIARVNVPGLTTVGTTPPHQDYVHVQGTTNTWTAWVPLGDCPRELGALSVLKGSHKEGVLPSKSRLGVVLEASVCESHYAWAETDFRCGDVLTFDSRTVHRALPHQATDEIRLSCDYRFQPVDEPVEERSLSTHSLTGMTWDEVYSGWPAGGIRYYWQDLDLQRTQWDDEVQWQKDPIC